MTRNTALLLAVLAVFVGGVSSFAGTGNVGSGSGTNPPKNQGAAAIRPLANDNNFNSGPLFEIVTPKTPDQFHRIVSNDKTAYVIYPAQTHDNTYLYDPWTIGQILGYLYELAEFGGNPPLGFQYTIDLMGKAAPKYWKKKRSAQKLRRATLVFTKKEKKAAPPPEPKKSVLSEEEKYWDGVLDNVWEDDSV